VLSEKMQGFRAGIFWRSDFFWEFGSGFCVRFI
jgi:hypothetical protein